MKVSELEGAALDWAVAKCEGHDARFYGGYGGVVYTIMRQRLGITMHQRLGPECHYSTDWAQGGPIIERECIEVSCIRTAGWTPNSWDAKHPHRVYAKGPTPLIAAMRCYVASKLGDEVTIPEEVR